MDGSVLSDSRVITASRDWVCVRLATYEDQAEAEFLASIFRGHSGELENTVFALMAPDGKTLLSRAGRSPHQVFGHGEDGIEALVAAMKKGAKRYAGTTNRSEHRPLPLMKDLRLALNVAACDHLPLAVLIRDEPVHADFEAVLGTLAWSESITGKMIWTLASSEECQKLLKKSLKPGLHLLAPDTFGLEAKLLGSFAETLKTQKLMSDVEELLQKFKVKPLSHREHVQTGRKEGKDWQTEVPVTDPGIPPPGAGGEGGERRPRRGPPGSRDPEGPPPEGREGPPPPRRER